eukprot:SAG25_NODE_161_length_13366_cov_13.111973_3_plen_107_part_00
MKMEPARCRQQALGPAGSMGELLGAAAVAGGGGGGGGVTAVSLERAAHTLQVCFLVNPSPGECLDDAPCPPFTSHGASIMAFVRAGVGFSLWLVRVWVELLGSQKC